MTEKEPSYIPVKEIARQLPVEAGETLWVTADLTRLAFAAARKERSFRPDDLIEGLQQVLTPEGTLVISAYNFDLNRRDRFDVMRTRPMTGALAEAAMKRKDFKRTQHPLHSFLVWGKHAESMASLKNESSFGSDSPFAYLLKERAKMLIIGTSVAEAFTFVHFVEEEEQVPYRKYVNYTVEYSDAESDVEKREYSLYAKKPGWTMDMRDFERHMIISGSLSEIKVNGVNFIMINLEDAYKILLDGWLHKVARFDKMIFIKDLIRKMLKVR